MSFANIDSEEIGVVLVIVIELNDVANLAAERRSSETAEDKDEWAAGGFFSDVKAGRTIERDKPHIRSVVAHLQVAAMHVGKSIADHVEGLFRPARHEAEKDVNPQQKSR
jgi:hypothetical protein